MRTKLSVFCDRLIEAGWLAVAAVIPFFFNVYSSRVFEPDKLTMLRSIALIMAVAFVIKTIESVPPNLSLSAWLRGFAKATPLTIPVLIYLAVYLFTTITSVAPAVSFFGSYQRLQGTLVTLSYLTVFFLTAYNMRTRVQLSRLLWVVVLDASIISFYGLIQHDRLDPLPWGGDVIMRVTSTMGNAIFLAAYLIMAVPLTIALLLSTLSNLAKPVQQSAKSAGSQPGFLSRPNAYLHASNIGVIDTLIVLVVGVSSFFLVLSAIQYVSFRRGLADFGTGSMIVLIFNLIVTLVGLAGIFLVPILLPALRRQRSALFLSVGLTAMLSTQVAAILFSQSRGPWIGMAISMVTFAYMALFRYKLYLLVAFTTVLILAGGSFVVLLNVSNSPFAGLKAHNQSLQRLGSIADTDSGTSKVRLLIWFGDDIGKGALGLIKSDPIRTLIGYGPESMYVAYNPFYPPALANIEARNASPDRSHNDFLDYLVTMGVIGLVSYLGVVVAFFGLVTRLVWRLEDRYYQFALIAFMAAVAGHLGETFVGIAIAATRTHFWLYLGAAAAVYIMARPKQANSDDMPVAASHPAATEVRIASPTRGGATTTRTRVKRRTPAPPPQTTARANRNTPGWLSILPLLTYLIVTLIAIPTMLLSSLIQSLEPPQIVFGGFGWFVLGLALTAYWVKRDERPSRNWRSSRWYIYALVVPCAIIVILVYFLNSIIADIYFKKGQAYDGVRRFDTGIHQYLKALSWAPSQDFYYLFLGRSYLELARSAPSQNVGQEIKTVEDLFSMDRRNLIPATREEFFNASLVSLKAARELAPLNTDNSANLGRLYRFWAEVTADPTVRQEKLDTSVKYYADALALSPNAAHLYDEWGLVYAIQGKWEEAFIKYEKALSLDKKYVSTYVYMGDGYMSQNIPDKAEQMYLQAVALDPSLINVHSSLGVLYYRQGKVQQSIDENLKAVQLSPNDLVSHRNLAIIYSEVGMLDKAIAEAQIALNLAPADQKASLQSMVSDLQQRMRGGQ
ncbi:MAG: tetratricopeptide repeat protein [Dehalococcoidia bacterium]|nr:tetratricopeptide repeat protein [Dehalococcoidia bacterium]